MSNAGDTFQSYNVPVVKTTSINSDYNHSLGGEALVVTPPSDVVFNSINATLPTAWDLHIWLKHSSNQAVCPAEISITCSRDPDRLSCEAASQVFISLLSDPFTHLQQSNAFPMNDIVSDELSVAAKGGRRWRVHRLVF